MALGLRPEPPAWGGLGGKGKGLESLFRAKPVLAESYLHHSLSCLPCQLPASVSAVLGSKKCEPGAGLALNEGDRCEGTSPQPRVPAEEAYPNRPQS